MRFDAVVGSRCLELSIEVRDSHILVGAPKGNFCVSYAKSPDLPLLVLESEWKIDRGQSPSLLAEYRAWAWRLANNTAVGLGWFD